MLTSQIALAGGMFRSRATAGSATLTMLLSRLLMVTASVIVAIERYLRGVGTPSLRSARFIQPGVTFLVFRVSAVAIRSRARPARDRRTSLRSRQSRRRG